MAITQRLKLSFVSRRTLQTLTPLKLKFDQIWDECVCECTRSCDIASFEVVIRASAHLIADCKRNDRKCLKITGNGQKRPEMLGNAWKWLVTVGNDWKCLERTRKCNFGTSKCTCTCNFVNGRTKSGVNVLVNRNVRFNTNGCYIRVQYIDIHLHM